MMKRSPPFLMIFLGALSALGVFAADPPAELEPITLQLKWKHQFQFAGYYLAIEKGFYRDAGLRVTLREAEFGVEPAHAVLQGMADLGIASSDLIVLHGSGEPVVALATIFQHSPFILLVSASAGVDTIHQIRGRKIMIEHHAAELLAYLDSEGIRRDQYTLVPHTFDPGALIRGEVDAMSAYSTDEPFLLEQAGHEHLLFTPRAGGIDFYGDTLFTTRDYLDENPDRVRRFLDASRRGWAHALDYPSEAIDLILEKYSHRHSREHLEYEARVTRRLILPDVVEIGYMNPGRWRHIADTYAQMGRVDPSLPLEGFLYDPDRSPDLTWIYLSWVGAALLILGISLTAARFYWLSVTVKRQTRQLQQALDETKTLKGLLPLCSHCKSVRNDSGFWQSVETYIDDHSDATITHGLCPDCLHLVYPELAEEILKEMAEEPGENPEGESS